MSQTDKNRADGAQTSPQPVDRELTEAELAAIAAAGDTKLPPGGPSKPDSKP
jgi:hypothetical protein